MISSVNFKRLTFDAANFTFLAFVLIVAVKSPSTEQLEIWIQSDWIIYAVLFTIAAGFAVSEILVRWNFKTLGELIFEPPQKKVAELPTPLWKTFWAWQLAVSGAVTAIVGVHQTHFSIVELFDRDGFVAALKLFRGLISPEWKLLPKAIVKVIETIFIALMATAIAVPISFLLSFLSAKNVMTHPWAFLFYGALRTFMNITRSVEPIIWAIIFSVWVGIGPFAGMLALLLHSIVSLTKQFSEIVESVTDGPIDGIRATGANEIQVVWFAIVPQVILPYISFTIYRWDINVRMATIIGFAGGGGIGTLLNQYALSAMWPEVGCLILVIAAVVWIMDITSAYVREALK